MYPVAPGIQGYGSLLIPEIWSPLYVEEFYESSVLEAIANTDYEGEISSFGDKINIRMRPKVEIHDYVAGQDLEIQQPDQPMTSLLIDRGHYFNFLIKDLDQAQSDVQFLEEWTLDAAESMNERVNEVVLGEIYADVSADNQGATAGVRTGMFNLGVAGTPVGLTPANIIQKIGDVATVLDEAKVPVRDRWGVIPPWIANMIYASPERNALITGGNEDLLRKRYIGELANFKLFISNQLSMVTDGANKATNVIFGHRSSLTFASQLTESEVIRAERKFGSFARGLNVYGFNTIKTDAMSLLYATPGTP